MATQLLFTPLMAFKNGVFSAGATVEFYLSGTTTAVTVTDVDGNTIAQPMAADSAGVFAEVYRSGGDAIKAVIKDSDGATIATVDPVAQVGDSGSAASGITFSPVTGNAATDAQTAIANNTAEINKTKAIGALGTNGILARTGTNTYASRTITAGAGIAVTNGNGASANPTIAVTTTEVTDWDDATADGHYWANSSAANTPTAHYHRGIVFTEDGSTTTLTQIVVRSAGDYIWMRRRNAGTWSDWAAVLTATSAGYAATWQDVSGSRADSTSYQNTLDYPIYVSVNTTTGTPVFQASTDNATWVSLGATNDAQTFVVNPDHYYRVNGATTIVYWAELR